jgi:two-component system, sporulation sensor kinase E
MKKTHLLLLYLFGSFIWIYASNYLLTHFVPSSLDYYFERVKEILYILVTGGICYFFILKKEELHTTKEEEKRLSTLINSMVDFVNFKDGEGRWIQANEFGLKLFQLENVDYRGKTDSELAQYSTSFKKELLFCATSDEETWLNGKVTRCEEVLSLPDGTIKTFDTVKVPLFHEDGSREGLVIIGRDITESRKMAKLLAESQQQYKSLFEYSPDIVYMIDLNSVVTNLNPQFEKTTGYLRDKIIGRNIIELLPEELREEVSSYFSSVVTSKEIATFEIEYPDAHGNPLTLQCTALPITINGEVAGIIGYCVNVTTLRQTEERLRRTEKLSVVGELSASVAHEIRNPLTSLKGFVQLLQMEDTTHKYYYQIMLDELNRINHIVGELLLLAKPQHIKFSRISIQKILNDVLSLLNVEASLYNVQIKKNFHEESLLLECEPNQLKQLFINIIKNSIEATKSGGTITITVDQAENNQLSITIKDTGCGISKDRLERIGEPFYSSKEKGTGLGLTVSFKIVQSHQGTIQFDSEIDEGTTVQILLPQTQIND